MQKKNIVETVQDGPFGPNEKIKIHVCTKNKEAKLPPIDSVRSVLEKNPCPRGINGRAKKKQKQQIGKILLALPKMKSE